MEGEWMKPSERIMRISNDIPDLTKSIKKRVDPEAIRLDIGDPDFPTPDHICDAAREAMRQGYTHYVGGAGDKDLIAALCHMLNHEYGCSYEPGGIIITAGGAGAIYLVCLTYLSHGDEAILFNPSYTNQAHCTTLAGAVPVWVPLAENFELDRDAVKKAITPKTRIIFLTNPNNPTGTFLKVEDVKFLAEIAIDHDLLLVADEVYRKLYYDGNRHFSAGSIRDVKDRTILIDSFSKTYAMTGWSVGYLATTPEIASHLNTLREARPGKVSAPAQRAALAALKGPQDCVQQMVDEYDRRRKGIIQRLAGVPGLHYVMPNSAFYFFCRFDAKMTSSDMVDYLYARKVSVRSGAQFGSRGEGGFRLSYSVPYHNVIEGINRIGAAFKELS
jgi:aminotransferase